MKKITFGFFMMLLSFLSHAQVIDEGFEGAAFPPTTPGNWAIMNNGFGLGQEWTTTSTAALVHSGTKAATIARGNIGSGNTSVDWLATPQITVPANGQLKFFTRQFFAGPNGTVYEIRVSTDPVQTNQAAYTSIQTWSEAQLNTTFDQYEEKVVNLNAYANQQVYIAFVRTITQPTISATGDTWFVDDVKVVQQCAAPTIPNIGTITSTTAVLMWTNNGVATEWEVECIPQSSNFNNVATATAPTNPFTHLGLIPNTPYQYQVRAKCGSGNFSSWVGPFTFTTKPPGSLCAEPIIVPTLPYQLTGASTANSADFVDTPQGASCGAVPTTTNYFAGNDVFYSYTATTTGLISVTMTPIAAATPAPPNTSLFIYNGCNNIGVSCLGGVANVGTGPRVVNLTVTAGQTYTIAISSGGTIQTFSYNLLIQREDCTPKPTALTATNIGLNSADLSWTSAPAHSTWEVAVQPLGSAIPTGAGEPATNPFTKGGLTAATQYQYWVRAECTPGSGIFTAWAGPFPFNTTICNPVDACTHTFIMRDSANNGWNGALMQVRQNGIVVGTVGTGFTTGGGPVSVPVQLCPGIPFDLVWSALGTLPAQCRIEIQNSFGQTIFPSTGFPTPAVGDVVYTNTVNCATPRCDIAPTNVAVASITTTSASISWNAPATTSWDIYIVPASQPAPTATSTPTYDDVTANPFATTIPLVPDTVYNVYIRVNCTPNPSPWSLPGTFTTLATCIKAVPQPVVAGTITTTSATLTWTNGTPTDTAWEILLIPGPNVPPTPPVNPVISGGTILIPTTAPSPMVLPLGTLTPATIYYYYIRTVCSPTDKSVWTLVPIKFNTITCAPADKCVYRFNMTDTGGDGWEGARMEVRQNGILISTIGSSITGSAATFNVPLCTNVPFELVWTIAGTAPAEIGVSIQNPFTDIVYTKPVTDLDLGLKYASTAICTPPTCPKPTNLVVINTGQTTAELNWTEMGTATQWEVYVAPVGSPAPVNGTPVSGTGLYHIANAPLSYTVTGLLPATAYIYYVRAICSPTDVGTWTILNPKTFNTKPVNDECAFAFNVPVNPERVCIQKLAGNTFGASASAPTLTGAGCTTADDDVWFKFTATNNIHIINLSSVVGGAVNHTVFSGDCTALVNLYCSAASESVATGLTVGQVYYVRVYTEAIIAGQSSTFDICIKTPPPPATNNECATALPVTVNTNGICRPINLVHGTVIGATASLPATNPVCTGTADDDVWFSFVATSNLHYISLNNVEGTTTNLNHAVYSGACGALVQRYCSAANSLVSDYDQFVVGQTYYIRVWSNSAASQVTTFDVCVRAVSTCESKSNFCAAGENADPFVYPNITGIDGVGPVACLGSTPNPTYYTLHIGTDGPVEIDIIQYESFLPDGTPVGQNFDVDFAAWGPFTSEDNCDDIVFADCPTCPNNTSPTANYPYGNILDCSFDPSFTETLHIPNALAGQYYVILVTNYEDEPGMIQLVQTNFDDAGHGTTLCCNVGLGSDLTACGDSTTLNALLDVEDLTNVPQEGGYQWFFNGSTTPIPGAVNSTYVATQSGIYKVVGDCNGNFVDDTIVLTLGPIVDVQSPADYKVCDDATNDGFASFDLLTLNDQVVLLPLNIADYNVTYHVLEANANNDTAAIDTSVQFTNTVQFTQTIYIRVESIAVPTCFDVVPVNLVVSPYVMPTFTLPTNICQNTAVPTLPSISDNGVTGIWSPLAIDATVVGTVTYTFTPDATPAQVCAVVITTDITIDPEVNPVFTQIANVCQNTTAPTLPSTSDDGVTGVWSPLTIDATVPGTVTYTFTPDATPTQICALPVTMDITVDLEVTPTFAAIPDVCINTTAPTLLSTSIEGITGTWLPAVIDATVIGTVTYTFTPDAGQCAIAQPMSVTVIPLTVPNFANIADICSGTTAPVLATTSPNGVTGTWNAPINTSLIGTTPYTFTPTAGLCADTQTLNVTIIQTLTPDFAPIPTFCAGTTPPSLATTSPNGVIGIWSPSVISNTANGTYTFTPSTIPGQCAVPIVLLTTVTQNPEFEVKGECNGSSYVLQALPIANYDVTNATFSWTAPNGSNAGNTQSIIATAIGTYTCVITYQGCSGEGEKYVDRISCTIQKGISPNGDGLNESFDLSGLGVKQLSIFNRYGTKVYNFSNYVNEWKGQTDNGNELPDGTYYYVIDQNNGETKSGWIYINR